MTFDTSPYPDYSLFILFALTGFVVFARYAASVSFTPHNVSGVTAETNGLKVKRQGWNGKNQHIELATSISYINAEGEAVNCMHDAIGNKAIAFVGTSGVQMGWLASQADMLAEDWIFSE